MDDSKALREALQDARDRLYAFRRSDGYNHEAAMGFVERYDKVLAAAPASPAGSGASEPQWDLEELLGKIFDVLAAARRETVRECDGEEMAEDVEAWSTREQYDLNKHTQAMMDFLVPELVKHLQPPAAVPSDSISERARELYRQLTRVQLSATAHQEQYEQTILAALEAERTDAFNLGAGGAYEDAAQRCEKNPGDAIGRAYAKAVRELASPDALAAVERIRQHVRKPIKTRGEIK